ncbi:MAG: TetR/AcrR family transcriptional regulator [Clostridiales bacterium]|nr:TetR/AcrR family transcriptional regulator [Clostridiales bacterium]
MAQPFTPEQRSAIRERLLASARRHAIDGGPEKTSLETLTSEAGISKSSFYKFFESKEALFLEVAAQWEQYILRHIVETFERTQGDSKTRVASMVIALFGEIQRMGIARFLREDLPALTSCQSESDRKKHFLSSSRRIFDELRRVDDKMRFTTDDSVVLSVIELLYLSILHIGDIGETYLPALCTLVQGACDRLIV